MSVGSRKLGFKNAPKAYYTVENDWNRVSKLNLWKHDKDLSLIIKFTMLVQVSRWFCYLYVIMVTQVKRQTNYAFLFV